MFHDLSCCRLSVLELHLVDSEFQNSSFIDAIGLDAALQILVTYARFRVLL